MDTIHLNIGQATEKGWT